MRPIHKACLLAAVFFVVLPFGLFPKDEKAKKEPAQKSPAVYRTPIDIILLNVAATDKEGKFVTDLTAEDFRIYDNGKPQTVQTFALESLIPAQEETGERKPASKEPFKRKDACPPRLISIFIDDLTMYSGSDFSRMFQDVKDFIKNDAGPEDQVCIISASGKVQFPFSNNKQQILDALTLASRQLNYLPIDRKLTDLIAWQLGRETWRTDSSASAWEEEYGDLYKTYLETYEDAIEISRKANGLEASEAATQSAISRLIADAKAQNAIVEMQTRKLLQVLRQHVRAFRHFEGNKMIVFFSDGILAEDYTPAAFQIQEIIDLALRSGIIFSCSNIVGVPLFMDINNILDENWEYRMKDMRAQESPLARMAHDTGGMFFTHSNDMQKQLQKIVRREPYRYMLSYGVSGQKADGSYHSIRLEVDRPGVELSYRKGYYTIKEELTYESSRREDIIGALHGPGNMDQIPIALEYNYSQEDDFTYSVSFMTDVDVRKIQFIDEDARRRNQISLVLAAFDETDNFISGLQKIIDFRLEEGGYTALREHGLNSRVELKLPIGRYKIKAVVRENTQGKIGSITKAVEIP